MPLDLAATITGSARSVGARTIGREPEADVAVLEALRVEIFERGGPLAASDPASPTPAECATIGVVVRSIQRLVSTRTPHPARHGVRPGHPGGGRRLAVSLAAAHTDELTVPDDPGQVGQRQQVGAA